MAVQIRENWPISAQNRASYHKKSMKTSILKMMWSLWVPILAGRGRVGQVVVEKRSLNAYVNGEKNRDREKAVEMARWSLRRGGRSGRFDCI